MNEHPRLSREDLHLPASAPGMRVGLLGGSFNPPHAAHRLISLYALKRLRLDRVWWLVSPGNPLKDRADLAPLAERVHSCRVIARDRRIRVTAFEAALGMAFTIDTLRAIRRLRPDVCFVWLMGADNLAQFDRWEDWREIFALLPIAVADRPGWRFRALSSKAVRQFSGFRIPESEAQSLPCSRPPAWCYLSGPLSPLSSSAIRRKRQSAQN
jgi:nicotinate-nucleotide adenylyltransferase